MNQKKVLANRAWLARWLLLCGLFVFASARVACAASSDYVNDASLAYTIPPQFLPTIDATNFLNTGTFNITFTKSTVNPEILETEDTLNYTNTGTMIANSSFLTNGSNLILNFSPGCGFLFDYYNTQSGLQSMASSFVNSGHIRANSFLDLGNQFLFVSTVGKCIVNATNIINPGTVELGENSLMQLFGKKVDLTRGTLAIDGILRISGADNGVGTDTNGDWIPSFDLGPTFALSSYFTTVFGGPFQLMFLTNSTPYFLITAPNTNSVVVRAIFLQNQQTNNVTAKVYWANSPFGGGGFFNVEWDGTYRDMVSGNTSTNYLYLNDDDVLGSLNPAVFNGIPVNFTFFEGNQELFFIPPATAGYVAAFQPIGEVVTNTYSYVDASFIPTTVITNNPTSQQNVTNYLKQISPGRIEINADNTLDLSLARISGQNYLSLRATNQFNGSVGAQIFSPYSDINLGVTNGFMTVTNLMEPALPNWNGGVQAWSARWISFTTNVNFTVDTNFVIVATNVFVVTNDYRILLVNSSLTPTTPSQVQDLNFHATNDLVISDVFNIQRSFHSDAKNLTLTTNAPGSASPDGELNLQALPLNGQYAFVWQNSLPNLQNLTNSGAIRIPNVNPVNMGTSASPYGAFINHGLFADFGVKIFANNFENDGVFSNAALGSFILQSQTTTLTNGLLYAGGDLSITADTLTVSNVLLLANRSLTLITTNLLTDGITSGSQPVTNGNFWTVGTNATSLIGGFNLPIKPVTGDLLGTTITNFAPISVKVSQVWAGEDRGRSTAGYTNNVAIGRLVLNAIGSAPGTQFYFSGAGASNAIYVDRLDLEGNSDYNSRGGTTNIPALAFNTNLVIYYADAVSDGQDVSAKVNNFNGGHLRWVPDYAGHFSSTNLVFAGQTNTFNIGLARNSQTDSDGDGIANTSDSTPFFLPSMVNLVVYATNNPAGTMVVSWDTIPLATNSVFYSTNLTVWQTLTNFISPQPYGSTATSVMVFDPIVTPGRYYQVMVNPWLTYPN